MSVKVIKTIYNKLKNSNNSLSKELEQIQANHSEQMTPIPTKLVAAEYSTAVQKFPNELIGARITSFENKYLMQKTFKESSKSDYRCMISVTRLHYLRRI